MTSAAKNRKNMYRKVSKLEKFSFLIFFIMLMSGCLTLRSDTGLVNHQSSIEQVKLAQLESQIIQLQTTLRTVIGEVELLRNKPALENREPLVSGNEKLLLEEANKKMTKLEKKIETIEQALLDIAK